MAASLAEADVKRAALLGLALGACTSSTPPSSGSIGPEGGTLRSSDGRLDVVVPPGALGDSVELSIVRAASAPAGGVGSAYEIAPDGVELALPVRLSFHYRAAELGDHLPAELAVGRVVAGAWEPVEVVEHQPGDGRIVGLTWHLSAYGVYGPGVTSALECGSCPPGTHPTWRECASPNCGGDAYLTCRVDHDVTGTVNYFPCSDTCAPGYEPIGTHDHGWCRVGCPTEAELVHCWALCGNGRDDPGEECDWSATAVPCRALGYDSTSFAGCGPGCRIDPRPCRAGRLDGGEPRMDGGALDGGALDGAALDGGRPEAGSGTCAHFMQCAIGETCARGYCVPCNDIGTSWRCDDGSPCVSTTFCECKPFGNGCSTCGDTRFTCGAEICGAGPGGACKSETPDEDCDGQVDEGCCPTSACPPLSRCEPGTPTPGCVACSAECAPGATRPCDRGCDPECSPGGTCICNPYGSGCSRWERSP